MLTLRELTAGDERAFLDGLESFAGEPFQFSFVWSPGVPYAAMLERLRADRRGEGLEPGRVPHTMLYAFVDGRIVGRVSVRHALDARLRRRGGHLGYVVAPGARRRGYATEMLAQALAYCRNLGLARIMCTCDDANVASWRLLERAGATLEEQFVDDAGTLARRYWLDLGEPRGPDRPRDVVVG